MIFFTKKTLIKKGLSKEELLEINKINLKNLKLKQDIAGIIL